MIKSFSDFYKLKNNQKKPKAKAIFNNSCKKTLVVAKIKND